MSLGVLDANLSDKRGLAMLELVIKLKPSANTKGNVQNLVRAKRGAGCSRFVFKIDFPEIS